MRAKLSLVLYMLLVEVVATYLVIFPVYAFQVSQSTTGWVRSLNASGASAMFSASRPSQLAAVASAASAGGSSLAIRLVAGLGWAGLGVAAGLLLYQAYYSSANLAAVKAGATPPATFSVPGWSSSISAHGNCPNAADFKCQAGYDQYFESQVPAVGFTGCAPSFAGWYSFGVVAVVSGTYTCRFYHFQTNPSTLGATTPGAVPTGRSDQRVVVDAAVERSALAAIAYGGRGGGRGDSAGGSSGEPAGRCDRGDDPSDSRDPSGLR